MVTRNLIVSPFTKANLAKVGLAAAVCLSLALGMPGQAVAQFGGGGGGGAGGGAGGGSTIGDSPFSGVAVDADGVLRRVAATDATGQLMQLRARQARTQLEADLQRPSKLRKVSLTRLGRLIDKSIAEGHGPDETMQHLAGLTRVQYVFFYPETNDIVVAGPAEAWVETETGRVIGIETGQPVMELQDLVVALRTFAPHGKKNPLVYCSIDPTQEGLQRMQQFLSRVGSPRSIGDAQFTNFVVEGLQESLGLQNITIGGVAADTHFAQVLVEADYRMKLIGIGLERPPVRIASYVALANPASVARNALQRWFFVPNYERVKISEDGHAAEFVGAGVKLVGEDEVVGGDGGRTGSGRQSGASRKFTRSFTDNYEQLAQRAPVYGQLRNCIDLLVAAAFIQQNDLYEAAGWDLGSLGEEATYPVQNYNTPKQVATAVNSMWKQRRLMTPVGGGVEIRADQALSPENRLADEGGNVASMRDSIDLSDLPADQWWWD
ncbi:DUF1598 domain-containing protein [Adhaeretor mobilis]|nr:DUF1598 domain-containing protein [Adhaeretor mobilis]